MIATFQPGTAENNAVTEWVAHSLKSRPWDSALTASVAVFREGGLQGAAIIHDWHPEYGVSEATFFGSRGWMGRGVWAAISDYTKNMGCNVLRVRTDEDNRAVIRTCRAIGFEETRIPNLRGIGKTEVNFVLTRDQWEKSRLFRRDV